MKHIEARSINQYEEIMCLTLVSVNNTLQIETSHGVRKVYGIRGFTGMIVEVLIRMYVGVCGWYIMRHMLHVNIPQQLCGMWKKEQTVME